MSAEPRNPLPEGVRVLSESEIQQRLYGNYHSRKQPPQRRFTPVAAPAVTDRKTPSPVWTGQEILHGELSRLRGELSSLRRERENLQSRLQRLNRPEVARRSSAEGSSGVLGAMVAWILVAGLLCIPFGMRSLQASPSSGDLTPYTVQVAVYDVKAPADRAVSYLKDLGYEAFLVDLRRRTNGKTRYRVYVGSFVTQEEADLERFKLSGDARFQDFKDAFVRLH